MDCALSTWHGEKVCVGEQWFEPGVGTPLARHAADVEEVISVIAGITEVSVENERRLVRAGQAVIIPAALPTALWRQTMARSTSGSPCRLLRQPSSWWTNRVPSSPWGPATPRTGCTPPV